MGLPETICGLTSRQNPGFLRALIIVCGVDPGRFFCFDSLQHCIVCSCLKVCAVFEAHLVKLKGLCTV